MATKKKTISLQEKITSYFKLNESTVSTFLGALVVIVIGVLIFNYFKSGKSGPLPAEENPLDQFNNQEVNLITNDEGKQVPDGLPQNYTVAKGDNLWKIAEKFYGSGYNWVDISTENNLADANMLYVGQELTIPQTEVIKPVMTAEAVPAINGDSYTVVKGDSLWTIAIRAYADGYQWPSIAEANNLTNPDQIEIGQVLNLPR